MIVRTPRPSSPTSHPVVPENSTSPEAFDLLPSLFFSRWIANGFRSPPGRTRGTRKQLNPPGACASTRNASDIGAEQNHLWPVSIHVPSPAGDAAVVFARTSEPPCFSVIAIPKIAPAFPSASAGSQDLLATRGNHS